MRITILILLSLVSCVENSKVEPPKPEQLTVKENPQTEKIVAQKLEVIVIKSEHGGYGFQIIQDGSPIIIQPHIPAVQGIKGFKTEEQAVIVGAFMIYKINNGVMPPSVSIHDLDSLGVRY